ncbi:tetratricopeptide repeat protein [Streptomyces sp. NPDC059037]|uniref:tetratricopeptide repeat protein n=1 Tax=Streptomyces sp. NPDC059037 TaxID=3346710 RepID=UPI0036D205CD
MASGGAERRPSMQELIRRRRRAGFVGRRDELAAFRENFDLPVDDERHRFLFHVHGNAGVGKTSLVRELEQLARDRGALTAYVDEAVGSVPEALSAIGAQFARQGRRFKDLDRLLAAHRDRRHEAESVSAAAAAALEAQQAAGPGPDPVLNAQPSPSPASMAAARASLVGLGLVPGVGAFAGAVDPAQLAQGADRLRAGLSARFRNQEDVQLVLSPERVLTPVLITELSDAAAAAPWIVLFFDTYEITAPILDGWLHEVMTTERHGALPANVVVVTAGQRPFDTTRWGGYADFMADVPLGPFTELESRGLLAGKGVAAEPVVEEVLRLTGGLPVLVSMLAEGRPVDLDDVSDPSATAVERFLKWEADPVRRAAALACALPRRLDGDVFRAAVDCADDEAPGLFGWLRALPFVSDRGDRVQYHAVVRAPMLRLQRNRSPRGWTRQQQRLAELFGGWRAEAEQGATEDDLWSDDAWWELRISQAYHQLCADPRGALPHALRGAVDACDKGEVMARRWAQLLTEAGDDAEAEGVGQWGRDLLAELADGSPVDALGLLLDRAGLDTEGQALARTLRGRELRESGEYDRALVEYDRAVELDPAQERAYFGRGFTHKLREEYAAALADLDRAYELDPDADRVLALRGETHRLLGDFDAAIRDLDGAIERDPTDPMPWADRGVARHALGRNEEALADLDRAVELDAEYAWALAQRSSVRSDRGEHEQAVADLDRALELAPEWAWIVRMRGHALRAAGRWQEALDQYGRAIELVPDDATAHAGRGVALSILDQDDEALTELDRAIELAPDYVWALAHRSRQLCYRDEYERALADADRAVTLLPGDAWCLYCRADALHGLGRIEEAAADLDKAVDADPDYGNARCKRGTVRHVQGRYTEAFEDLDRALELDPDAGWYLMRHAITCRATGRIERALADMARYNEVSTDSSWGHENAARIHLWCGRPREALAEISAAVAAGADETDLLEELSAVHRRTGRWSLAREAARRMSDEVDRLGFLALAESGERGAAAAAPLWRELFACLPRSADGEPDADSAAMVAAAQDDWPALDTHLTAFVTSEQEWDDLAELAQLMTELLHAPGADRARLAPRLGRVTAAREAIRERYA